MRIECSSAGSSSGWSSGRSRSSIAHCRLEACYERQAVTQFAFLTLGLVRSPPALTLLLPCELRFNAKRLWGEYMFLLPDVLRIGRIGDDTIQAPLHPVNVMVQNTDFSLRLDALRDVGTSTLGMAVRDSMYSARFTVRCQLEPGQISIGNTLLWI